jgi:N-acetylglucosaminyldiphosphoundecaprenol N-acetyl-beta-D-mannosaminyltransferase
VNISERKVQSVLGAHIDALTWDDAINRISAYASARESRYVCICNVHSVITATRDPTFLSTINNADMATPDGAPIAWSLRMMGYAAQERINGPDLMWRYLEVAQQLGQRIFFVGSTQATLCKLRQSIMHHFPHTHICGMLAPPFRALSVLENQEIIDTIHQSGAHIVFVGLGCPKQEQWMAKHRGLINAVMIGVGAAFDYHAGTIKRAPIWWQRHGVEWLYRLAQEPRRLLRRYVVTNTLFVLGMARQFIHLKIFK